MNIVKLQDIKLTHRNLLQSYTLTMRRQKEKLGNNSIHHCNEKNKILRNKSTREEKDLYIENYKTLMKKSKRTQIDGEIYHVHGLEESI